MGPAIYACAVEDIVTSMLIHLRTYGMFSSKQGSPNVPKTSGPVGLIFPQTDVYLFSENDHDIEDAIG